MEYEFMHDPSSGYATAQFSLEHITIGPWLEVEVGNNADMLSALLLAIDEIESGQQQEIVVTGKEYSVTLSTDDVIVQPNMTINGAAVLSEELVEQQLEIDNSAISSCGLDDFRQILLSWAKFTNN